jgi:hypothetical protein
MIVEMTNTETKQTVLVDADGIDVDALKEQFKLNFSAAELRRIIDNLDIPAEAKGLLTELLNFTIKAGTVVLEVGKKIIEVVKALAKNFPNITAGIIIGVTLSLLVSCIPIFGPLLAWISTPLFLLLGVGAGILKEYENTDLGKALKEVVETIFSGLKKIPVPTIPVPV